MDFYEVVYSRRAIRKYKPDMIPKETLLKILDAANWAPSGMNMQQWEFIVVSGPKKNMLGESYARFMESYTHDWDPARKETFLKFARDFGGSPLIIVALTQASKDDSIRKMHLESVSAAFENLLLAARAEGLGSCWMTGPLRDEAGMRKILDIGDDNEIVAVTPIGFPDMAPIAPERLDPELKSKIRWVE